MKIILEIIFQIVTIFVTFFLGLCSKKCKKINNKIIPIQNLCVGLISTLIYYLFTKDINLVLIGVGLFTGGTYDVINNLKKILTVDDEEKKDNN